MKITLSLFLLFFVTGYACATVSECLETDRGFRQNSQGRGWFWKQQACVPKADNKTTAQKGEEQAEWKILPQKANIPWELLDRLDPSEIAGKIEPEARKVSVMYPTEENIMNYRKLNNWLLAKSITYANADERVRTENPSLMPWNENLGTSAYKQNAIYSQNEQEKQQTLAQYSGRAGLVIYVSATCGYCEKQVPILDMFAEKYGWDIVFREIAEYPQETVSLSIATVPDIFIAFKGADNRLRYQRIATGLTTLDLLEKAALRGLSYLGETLNETLISY